MLVLALLLSTSSAAPEDAFTLVALPDTQNYACSCNGGSSDTFTAQTAWIVEALATRDVRFVTQLGDCVQNGDEEPSEWAVANAAFSLLEDPATTGRSEGLPYGIAVGNHDQTPFGDAAGTTTLYNATFGVERFQDRSWYGDHYGDNNDNHYQLFSGGGTDYLVLHLEYDPLSDPQVLTWARNVLVEHQDRLAIVVSHYLIDTEGAWGDQGLAIYDALKDQPNLLLMLSGHILGTGQRSDTWGTRTVHTLLSDYQGMANGGDGWLRLLRFSRSEGTLSVQTWSPTLGAYENSPENAFTLEVDLNWPPEPSDTATPRDSVPPGDSPTDSDSVSDSTTDTAGESDTQTPAVPADEDPSTSSCGCTSGGSAGGAWILSGLFALRRRRYSKLSR